MGIVWSYGNILFNFLRNCQDHSFYFLNKREWWGGESQLLLHSESTGRSVTGQISAKQRWFGAVVITEKKLLQRNGFDEKRK